jgi:hypothetical protein
MSSITNFIRKINNITSAVRSVTGTVRAVKDLRNQFRGRTPSSASRSTPQIPGTTQPSYQFKPIGLSQVSSRSSGRNVNPRPVRPTSAKPKPEPKIR